MIGNNNSSLLLSGENLRIYIFSVRAHPDDAKPQNAPKADNIPNGFSITEYTEKKKERKKYQKK